MRILIELLGVRLAGGRKCDHRWHTTILKERILEFKRPNEE